MRLVALEIPGGDRALDGKLPEHPLDDVQRDVHHRELCRPELARHVHGDAVRRRVLPGRLERHVVDVDRGHRREPELGGSDGEDARAAADVEQAARLQVLQELEAETCRRVRAGAEGAARIDDDGDFVRRRLFPRRADPQTADGRAVMERAPPVLPALGDVVDRDDVEAERRFLGVDGVGAVELLDALREDVEQERELGLAADDDVPPQRKALLSLSKSPPSTFS